MTEEIHAEMAASVIGLYVTAGATVETGQMLVLLESMKMEIPVNAEQDGVIDQITVRVGDVVRRGDLIAILDTTLTAGCSGAPRAATALQPTP